MRIHTDKIEHAHLRTARKAANTPEDGYVRLHAMEHGSRSRARAFEVGLEGDGTRNKRRRNPGTRRDSDRAYDKERQYAATWDAWGRFLAHLYTVDPSMVAGPYKNADDFHDQTHGHFTNDGL